MRRISKGKAKMIMVQITRTKWQHSLKVRTSNSAGRTVSTVLNKPVELEFSVRGPSADILRHLLYGRGICKSPKLAQQLVPWTHSIWESNFPRQVLGQPWEELPVQHWLLFSSWQLSAGLPLPVITWKTLLQLKGQEN